MTVYQGEEVSIEISALTIDEDVVWINVDGQNVGELMNINHVDRKQFTEELKELLEKYKV